jgi:hypothetical protein
MRNASLELLCDTFRDQLGVQFRLPNFVDIHVYLRILVGPADDSLQILCQFVYAFSASADHSAGSRRVKRNAHAIRCSLDVYAANVAHPESRSYELANLIIANKQRPIRLLVRKPMAIRIANYPKPKSDRMYFLTQ